MKCNYCGHEIYENDLFCRSCGKELNQHIVKCENCGVGVPNQYSYCNKCGTPVNQVVQEEISVDIYEPLQVGDNQIKDTNEIGLNQVAINALNEDKKAVKDIVNKNYWKDPIIWIISVASLIVCIFLYQAIQADKYLNKSPVETNETDNYTDKENEEEKDSDSAMDLLTNFKVNGENSVATNQSNLYSGGYTYMYKDKLYITLGQDIVEMDLDFTNQKTLSSDFSSSLMVDDNYYYYGSYAENSYVQVSKSTNESTIIIPKIAGAVQRAGNTLYYQKIFGGIIYAYDIDTKQTNAISKEEDVNEFIVDQTNNRIIYMNANNKLCMSDLAGENVAILVDDEVSQFICEDNIIYYCNYVNLNSYNLTTKEINIICDVTGNPINIINNQFVYTDYDGAIHLINKDGTNEQTIYSQNKTESYLTIQVLGDKIICYDEMGQCLVIDLDGNYGLVGSNQSDNDDYYDPDSGIDEVQEF